jgi:hypothetical protein
MHKAALSFFFLVFLLGIGSQAQAYPYGILPSNRDYEKVLEYWEAYKQEHISIGSGKASVSGLWEFQAFAMVFAAYLEEDDELVSKLWNRVAADRIDWNGQLWMEYSAADVLVDIGMGLDRAAVRWGGKWDDLAERWIKALENKLEPWNRKCGCWDAPSEKTGRGPLHCKAIAGDACGHYINYYAFSHFFRFDQRTNQDLWMTEVMDACFHTMEWSYHNHELPAWYVRMKDPDGDGEFEAMPVLPAEINNVSNTDKWDGGATRTAWRVPFAYMAYGNQDAYRWSEKMLNFYKSKESDPGMLSLYRPSSGAKYGGEGHTIVVCGAGVLACAMSDQDWADRVWDWLVDPANYNPHRQHDSQRLYCLLKMSGKFDVFGDATVAADNATAPKPESILRIPRGRITRGFVKGLTGSLEESVLSYVDGLQKATIYTIQGQSVATVSGRRSLATAYYQLAPGSYFIR